MIQLKHRLSIAAGIALLAVACAAPQAESLADGQDEEDDESGEKVDKKGGKTSADGGAAPEAATCPYSGPPVPVDGFATCLDGGRCVPTDFIPANERSRLASCSKGLCVPEKIIAANGVYLPPSCTSVGGGEGRCVSTVFPDMEKQKASLPQDTCAANERCAPCFDPTTGADTGACSSIPCDSPKLPKVVFADCCNEGGKPRGKCVPLSLIPEKDQSGLDAKECDASKARCAPAETLAPDFKPPKCAASNLLGKYDGVCISTCVHMDFLTKFGTGKGDCTDGFFCAPCKNPLTGAPSGAPGCD